MIWWSAMPHAAVLIVGVRMQGHIRWRPRSLKSRLWRLRPPSKPGSAAAPPQRRRLPTRRVR